MCKGARMYVKAMSRTPYHTHAHCCAAEFPASAEMGKQHSQRCLGHILLVLWVDREDEVIQSTAITKKIKRQWNSTSQGELFERFEICRGPQSNRIRQTIGAWSSGLRPHHWKSDCSIDKDKYDGRQVGQDKPREDTKGQFVNTPGSYFWPVRIFVSWNIFHFVPCGSTLRRCGPLQLQQRQNK